MYSLNTIKYYIFNLGPKLWNNVINKEGKNILFCLSKKIKLKLIELKLKSIILNDTL